MNEIYVVGHRNPDTDSIVAAMSYAALRNALGDRDYVAAYLGHVSDETQHLLVDAAPSTRLLHVLRQPVFMTVRRGAFLLSEKR